MCNNTNIPERFLIEGNPVTTRHCALQYLNNQLCSLKEFNKSRTIIEQLSPGLTLTLRFRLIGGPATSELVEPLSVGRVLLRADIL